MINNDISLIIRVFHGRIAPEEGILVGYGAIIESMALPLPMPTQLCIISSKKRQYSTAEWQVFTPRHLPKDTLYNQLVFALKYEGINLLFFKKLFEKVSETEMVDLVQLEPQGLYSRKIWFLYEWLMQKTLPIENLTSGNYVALLDTNIQFCIENGSNSNRHRIKNNLPGTVSFCPLIYKTKKLQAFIELDFSAKNNSKITGIRKHILLRTAAFLLLKDSKASFSIEGENPIASRAMRWGKAIGEAGKNELTKDEFLRLQQIVIENNKFIKYGYRQQEGFVGEHDRDTFQPLPDHIAAKYTDVETLMEGLLATNQLMQSNGFHLVLAAACIAFGFVFIHPLVDGNGRLHRYIIHNFLSKSNFTAQGIIFPISASILQNIVTYRKLLENHSHAILPFINWQSTANNNVAIANETIDLYSYYDATPQAEFLFDSMLDTIENIIPNEVKYIIRYDEFKNYIDNVFEMPDKKIALLVLFLQSNNGKLSKNKNEKEFSALSDSEVNEIEIKYGEIFGNE